MIEEALARTSGNKAKAAQALAARGENGFA
jgi:Bacterial regulatory protein, Fis family